LAPSIVATITVAVFTLPSFFQFEPRATHESVGFMPALLACVCGVLLMAGCSAALKAARHTTSLARTWRRNARAVQQPAAVRIYETSHDAPLLAMSGILRPTVWVSASVMSVLSSEELARAVQHELMHARRRDNLSKLLVLFCRFPRMRHLERAWHEAMEMAADERSVHSKSEALDLAAALVKVSRLSPCRLPDLATGFAASAAGSIPARVTRLLAWNDAMPATSHFRAFACAALVTIGVLTVTYQPILVAMHEVTEWLVR
jgi:beta-lactamase regulating signal transducer with metallopeptidase domain